MQRIERKYLSAPFHVLARRISWRLRQYLPEYSLTCGSAHGRLSFSSHDLGIGKYLYLTGGFDLHELQRTVQLLQRHGRLSGRGLLIDVGANIGTTCLYMLQRGYFAHAWAFEPEPQSYRYLRRNIRQNGWEGAITTFSVALSDCVGEARLALSTTNHGDSRVRTPAAPPPPDEATRRCVPIALRPLDNILAAILPPRDDIELLWLDTQGHEVAVLKGAHQLLEKRVPIVLELWPDGLRRAGCHVAELQEVLAPHYSGFYDLRLVNPDLQNIGAVNDVAAKLTDADDYTDLLFIP